MLTPADPAPHVGQQAEHVRFIAARSRQATDTNKMGKSMVLKGLINPIKGESIVVNDLAETYTVSNRMVFLTQLLEKKLLTRGGISQSLNPADV